MVEGSSAVKTPQQLEIQDVQRTRPISEQRQGSDDVQARGMPSSGRTGRADDVQRAGEESLSASSLGMDQLKEIRDSLNEAMRPINIALDFEEREEMNDLVVKVLNRETDEVIRQIPPESMLKMAQRIEDLTGLLVDTWR